MAVKTEKDLSDSGRTLWLKALSAIELRNHKYAISLLQAVLKETPEFIDARKLLRKAEKATVKGRRSLFASLSATSLRTGSLLKKNPKAAMEIAEKSLESNPYSVQANNLLKDAAVAAGIPEVAAFALETIAEGNPGNLKVLHQLAEFYSRNGESEKAVEIYNRITEINPADLVAVKKGKDAAARATMTSGGWETAKDYRDLIRDKDQAVSLEQQSRVMKSDEMINQQINELYKTAEREPLNIDVARRIASLFEQKEELDSALWWYDKAFELSERMDNVLERKVSDLQLKVLDNQIREYEDYLASVGTDEPGRQEYENGLASLRQQRAGFLITEARKRVERYPTDLLLRFELGEQLLLEGQYTLAIPELQKARQNPNVRVRAMNLLGQCYYGKGMLDFAVRTFQEAIRELPVMDRTKKELLYRLGVVQEEMGKSDEALDCMKQIYDVDYGYRDVAHRVESSYRQ
jgi:tetratricopeptide (TPR) repeat protein